MAEPLKLESQGADCNIPNACERVVPTWLIVLDNAPTAVLFLLGTAIIWNLHSILSLVFLAYCCLSIVLFWKLICPWCHHFGTTGCPCGYSRIAARLFKKKTGKEFRRVFRRNIVVVFPCWFLPLAAGIYLLWTDYSRALLFLLLAFCFVGFVLIPAISKFVGCRSCEIKDQCPWMS
ncbi:MAG: hypothetical protein JXR49_12450 [Acidobacteria bacterium]|nr:hypothetical protein [Acidobacteriota bacterium]